MIEVRPHVYVAEDFARANGMSRLIPKREPKPDALRDVEDKPC